MLFVELVTLFKIRVILSQILVVLFSPPIPRFVISIFFLFHHPMPKDLESVSTCGYGEHCNVPLVVYQNMFYHCMEDQIIISSWVLKFFPSQILSLLNRYLLVNPLLKPTQFLLAQVHLLPHLQRLVQIPI